MTIAATIFSILGALIVIAGFVVSVWVLARAKGQEATIDRVSRERDDYRSRVEFIEPRLTKALEENATLQVLHNPAERLKGIKADTTEILGLLRAQASEIRAAQDRAEGK